ncbi:unnamed protein product [Meloidogyne enterolobii]|uniref:Uncharacterized protein n=1 Tax=Meloidogyne enterolobii TaxID=390850 RepID=A0ACB0XRF7_MELEN
MSTDEHQSNDRILHAKNLLKKFQSKHTQRSEDFNSFNSSNGLEICIDHNILQNSNNSCSSSPSILPNFSKSASETRTLLNDGNLINGPIGSFTSELLPFNQKEVGNQVRCYSVPENLRIEEGDLNGSRSLLIQKEEELATALSKLNSLHSSYSELYNAYNRLVEKKNNDLDGRETPVHINNQIQQLQIALTHSLEEKTNLQKELRELKTKMEELQNLKSAPLQNQQNDLLATSLTTNLIKSDDFSDLRLANIQQERDELLSTVSNLSQQIEEEWKLSSNLEAKLFLAQQDKMDTQAHLKSIYHDKVQLEQNYEHCKKELAMRDIYLQQLSKQFQFEHLPKNVNFEEKNEENKKSSSNEQLISLKLELDNSQKNVQTLQEQLQITSLQANSQLKMVEEELETTRAKFNEICSLKDYLEESLRIAQATIEKDNLINNNSVEDQQQSSTTELESLKQQISNLLLEKEQQLNLNKQTLDKLEEEKNGQIEELKSELNEAMERIGELEKDKIIRGNIDQDASTLSIQLQNEKATVSRAIAQNLELKTQLGELQNRLVQVINSSAEKEDERLTALNSVSKLTQALNELKEEKEKEENLKELVEKQVQTDNEGISEVNLQNLENKNVDQSSTLLSSDTFASNDSLMVHVPSSDQVSSIETELSEENVVEEEGLLEGNEQENKEEQGSEEEKRQQDEEVKLNGERKVKKTSAEMDEEELKVKEAKRHEEKEEAEEGEENNRQKLQKRLEQLCQENEQFRLDNQKLQYWLTAVETENESIGEYVALYRFQRGNVQKRIAENEAMLKEYKKQNFELMTQLSTVCNSLNSFLMAECIEEVDNQKSEEENNLINKDSHNNELVNDRHKQIDNLRKIVGTLQKIMPVDQKAFSEATCSGSNSGGGGAGNLQARCVGCRGEITTL